MKNSFDILIIGGGPGGATAALCLADSGLSVAVVDKAIFPRDKICGDALSGKVISVLKHISPAAEASLHAFPEKLGSYGIRFIAPNREVLDIPFRSEKNPTANHAPGYISTRMDFDHFLLKQLAPYENITVMEGFSAKEIHTDATGIHVSDGTQTLTGKIAIGADGAHSIVTKQLSDIEVERNHYSAGIRAYYKGVTDFHNENFIELHYIKDLLPGYFWVFPLANGMANVGLGMLSKDVSKYKVNLKERLLDVVANDPVIAPRFADATLEGKIMGFGLPLGSKKRKISGDRFMLIGDAASLIDPFSGEGIGNAMLSGKIAAAQAVSAIQENNFSADFLEAYDREVYRKLWSELNLSHKMQKLVNYPWLFNFVAKKANRNEALRTMMTMMFENLDIRKELSKPGFYWKLVRG